MAPWAGKKTYCWDMYIEMRRRFQMGRWHEIHFPDPETPAASSSVPPDRSAAPMWLATAEVEEEKLEGASDTEGPPSEPDPVREVFELSVGRLDEEPMCRVLLTKLWLDAIPITNDLESDSNKLWDVGNDYETTFLQEHTRLFEVNDFPRPTRFVDSRARLVHRRTGTNKLAHPESTKRWTTYTSGLPPVRRPNHSATGEI